MAYELVAEVLDHAPADLTPAELTVLVSIAEWIHHDHHKRGIRLTEQHKADLAGRARVKPSGLPDVLERLAKRGLDVRVKLFDGKDGRPVYATPRRKPRYRLPQFTAPTGCTCQTCRQGSVQTDPYPDEGRSEPNLGSAETEPRVGLNRNKGRSEPTPTGYRVPGEAGGEEPPPDEPQLEGHAPAPPAIPAVLGPRRPGRCPRHADDPDHDAPCRACGQHRERAEQWDRERRHAETQAVSRQAHERARLRALAIAECAMCDSAGYIGTKLCDHDPDSANRAARGRALWQAALQGGTAPREVTADVP